MKKHEKRIRADLRRADQTQAENPRSKFFDTAVVFRRDLMALLGDVDRLRAHVETYGVHGEFCDRSGKKCVTCEALKGPKS